VITLGTLCTAYVQMKWVQTHENLVVLRTFSKSAGVRWGRSAGHCTLILGRLQLCL
jgi:histidinol-phosphate/aromatic aminotransferase/cobyric acid decarboxylase-like protein